MQQKSAGDKAYNVALLSRANIRVPRSAVLTVSAYKQYLRSSGLDAYILREINRKKLSEYRWEELWDISLRIKNSFLRHEMPREMQLEIDNFLKTFFHGTPVAVRSSAPGEDGSKSSFAGLHESYLNLSDIEEVRKHVRLVWASLWSVSALLYRKELNLDPFKSSMAVLIQEVVSGQSSGVAFSVAPDQPECVAVEAVYGLNQGLVDGSVEPDHWNIDRKAMTIRDFFPASERNRLMRPVVNGIELVDTPRKEAPPITQTQVVDVAAEAMRQERHFGHPRDVEWTFRDERLIILQSRPITTSGEEIDSRKYYDNLLPGVEQLKETGQILERKILPDMLSVGNKWKERPCNVMTNAELLDTLIERGQKYRFFLDEYEQYCIPFGHGVRLFGEIYNSMLKPDDPYEFVDVLRTDDLLSLQRNRKLKQLAHLHESKPDSPEIIALLEDVFGQRFDSLEQVPEKYWHLADNFHNVIDGVVESGTFADEFIATFEPDNQNSARELLELGRASYRLRDDDNMYLNTVKAGLEAVINEARMRLDAGTIEHSHTALIETELQKGIPELHSPSMGMEDIDYNDKSIKFRQLTGQPAGKGSAKGKARVINEFDDLFEFQEGEVLVCDAVDPEMTIVAPLAAAVVERRGGMLIHGAIIAREYGLPCVTGVPDATRKIKTGDTVSVDGWLGIVTIL